MNDLIPIERIENKIYLIRGEKVMLDFDLAELYEVSTGRLNEQVKRNLDRFPGDFMFSLTRQEILRISQFAISSSIKFSKNVTAFTEQGVAMLSGILRSKRAVAVNIAIMRVFVKLRKMISTNKELAHMIKDLERRVGDHDVQILALFKSINKLLELPPDPPKKRIGFIIDDD